MTGADKHDLRESQRRIETLIGALEADPDGEEAAAARELVSLILDLHSEGLVAIVAVLGSSRESETLLARVVDDERARALLLLHGLHPDSIETRVRRSVDRLRAQLGVEGIRVEVDSVEDGEARVRIDCHNGSIAGPQRWLLPVDIEQAIIEAAPEIETVRIEGLDAPGIAVAAQAAE